MKQMSILLAFIVMGCLAIDAQAQYKEYKPANKPYYGTQKAERITKKPTTQRTPAKSTRANSQEFSQNSHDNPQVLPPHRFKNKRAYKKYLKRKFQGDPMMVKRYMKLYKNSSSSYSYDY